MSSARGLRVLKALETYCNGKRADFFDSKMIFSKLKSTQLAEGCFKASFTVDPSMCNVGDYLHGGYMASVIDAVSLYALIGTKNGRLSWTTNMNVSFFKPASLGDTIKVESSVLKTGAVPVMEVTLQDNGGAPVAKGTVTFTLGKDEYQYIVKDGMDLDVFEK